MPGQPFSEETRQVTNGSTQPSQQKSEKNMELPRKDLWKILLSNGIDPHRIQGRTTMFFETVGSAKALLAHTEGDRDKTK